MMGSSKEGRNEFALNHEVAMRSDSLNSLAFHGHGGQVPPRLVIPALRISV